LKESDAKPGEAQRPNIALKNLRFRKFGKLFITKGFPPQKIDQKDLGENLT
jgi:hypothetical protein